MTKRVLRTIDEIDEEYYRNNLDELDSYLETVFEAYAEDGDMAALFSSLRMVARVKGVSSLARETNLTRNGIQKALSEQAKPRFDTINAIINAMGYDLTIQKHQQDMAEGR